LPTIRLVDDVLRTIADAAGGAIGLRVANYEVFDPADPQRRPKLAAHFALRYGGRRQD